ncbi:hypothetical protein BJX99DRAFT_258964 [Aspergillus californicus]
MAASKPSNAFQTCETEKRFGQFTSDLKMSVNHANAFKSYRKTAEELLDVFKTVYGFEVENFLIPSEQPQSSLVERLAAWSRRNCGEDTLRVYVYLGSARFASTVTSHWELIDSISQKDGYLLAPTLEWWSVSKHLEKYAGDMCYIFDCCSADPANIEARFANAELMVASVHSQPVLSTSAHTSFSFTQSLAQELRRMDGRAETLAGIYARLFHLSQKNEIEGVPIHIPNLDDPSVTIGRNNPSIPNMMPRSIGQDSSRVLLSVNLQIDIPWGSILTQWSAWLSHHIPANAVSRSHH